MENNDFNNPVPQYDQQPPQKNSTDGKAVASLICGIVGLFIFGIILGIVSIVLANQSVKATGPSGLAKTGKILGIIDIVFFFIMLILGVVAGVGLYAFG